MPVKCLVRLLLYLGLVCTAVTLAAGPALAAVNLAANPGFENGSGTPEDWLSWTEGAATFTWDQTVSRTGLRSLKINNSTSANTGWYCTRSFSVVPGQVYSYAGWVKTQNATGSTYINIAWFNASGWISNTSSPVLSGTNDWKYLLAVGQAPAGATYAALYVRSEGNSGAAWFDDVSGLEIVVQRNLAVNYRFEDGAGNTVLGWEDWLPDGGSAVWDNAVYFSGTRSLKLAGTGANAGWFATRATAVSPGDSFTLSALVKTSGATGATYLCLAWFDAGGWIGNTVGTSVSGTADWRRLTVVGQAPANAVQVIPYLRSDGNAGAAWFEDVQFRPSMAPNPGFEDGGTEVSSWYDWGTGTFTWDGAVKRTGARSLAIAGSSGNAGYFMESFQIDPDREYLFSGWAKTSNAAANSVYINISWFNESGWLGDTASTRLSGTNDWTQLVVRALPPPHANHATVYLRSDNNSGTVWFDDLELYVEPAVVTSLTPNRSFEQSAGTRPLHWTTWGSGSFTYDTAYPRTGRYAVKIYKTTGNAGWCTADQLRFVVDPAKQYTFTAYAKTSNASTNSVYICMAWYDTWGTWISNSTSSRLSGTANWTKLSVTATPPANARRVQFYLRADGNNGTVWFDDVCCDGFGDQNTRIILPKAGLAQDGVKEAVIYTKGNYTGGTFALLNAGGGTVHSGNLSSYGVHHWGGYAWFADFTPYATAGTGYKLRVTFAGQAAVESEAFEIKSGLYTELARKGLGFYYPQRCGMAIADWHAACHVDDGTVRSLDQSNYGLILDNQYAVGGWHDAGDYNKWEHYYGPTVNGIVSVSDILGVTWEDLNEGYPDPIAEALWEVRMMQRVQETFGPNAGTFRSVMGWHPYYSAGVWKNDFWAYGGIPENETDNVVEYTTGSASGDRGIEDRLLGYETGAPKVKTQSRSVMALARFARVIGPYDASWRDTAKAMAISARNWCLAQNIPDADYLETQGNLVLADLELYQLSSGGEQAAYKSDADARVDMILARQHEKGYFLNPDEAALDSDL
ncbi:MAG: carbohydrate binding domain-containing protein, partial [Bacteroidota bacterium]